MVMLEGLLSGGRDDVLLAAMGQMQQSGLRGPGEGRRRPDTETVRAQMQP